MAWPTWGDDPACAGATDAATVARVTEPPQPTVTLPLDMAGRRWRVGSECGDVFVQDDDFDGLTLTLELHDRDEARAVCAALCAATR